MPSVIESPSGRVPEKAQDGISREQRLAAAKKYFGGRWFGNILEFIEQELGLGDSRSAHKPGRHPLGRGLRACGPLGDPLA